MDLKYRVCLSSINYYLYQPKIQHVLKIEHEPNFIYYYPGV